MVFIDMIRFHRFRNSNYHLLVISLLNCRADYMTSEQEEAPVECGDQNKGVP